MPPSRDQTGVPGLVAFAHFHSSTTSGSAALMISRTLLRVFPRQSPSSRILSSMSSEADLSVAIATSVAVERRARAGALTHASSQCLDADEIAGGIAKSAVPHPVGLLGHRPILPLAVLVGPSPLLRAHAGPDVWPSGRAREHNPRHGCSY